MFTQILSGLQVILGVALIVLVLMHSGKDTGLSGMLNPGGSSYGGTAVMESHGRYIGPGGQSILADSDGDLLVYHYYDGNDGGRAKLGINQLGFTGDGWPFIR